MRKPRIAPLSALLVFALPGAVSAQAPNLAQLLPRLLSEAVTMPSTAAGVAGNPHEAHFLPDAAQLVAPYALNSAVVSQLATFPIGSSSGGFTYTTDDKTGLPARSSANFGPAFAERALTVGKGRFTAGFNLQRVEYGRFEGRSLSDGSVGFVLRHNECCPGQGVDGTPRLVPAVPTQDANPAFEGDIIEAQLSLGATTQTAAFFASYGLTNRLDLGVAVPIVRVELTGTMTSRLDRIATASNPSIHSFAAAGSSADPDTKVVSERGEASGLGDIAFRAKYRALLRDGGGLAIGVDLRLPTGDEDQLLGTGATQFRPYLIWSQDFGRFSPHINAGYTWSNGSVSSDVGNFALGDDVPAPIATAPDAYGAVFHGTEPPPAITQLDVPDEIGWTVGFAAAAHPRLTLTFDAIGRTLLDVNRFGVVTNSYSYRVANAGPLLTTEREAFDVTRSSGTLTLALGVAGFKLNISKTLLLNAQLLFPLTDGGLRPGLTPVIGLDYAF
jgi:hypothetical protein